MYKMSAHPPWIVHSFTISMYLKIHMYGYFSHITLWTMVIDEIDWCLMCSYGIIFLVFIFRQESKEQMELVLRTNLKAILSLFLLINITVSSDFFHIYPLFIFVIIVCIFFYSLFFTTSSYVLVAITFTFMINDMVVVCHLR